MVDRYDMALGWDNLIWSLGLLGRNWAAGRRGSELGADRRGGHRWQRGPAGSADL